jgi:DNA-directed RNA polymerase
VYTGVSEFVKKSVAKDAAEGNKVAQVLDGRITRKVVKQTVMTNVYGVTFMGAMRQVRRQLNDHFPDLSNEMKKDGALYIARKIFEALGSMFNGAHEIQYWLGDCATRITQSLTPEQIEAMANEALSPSQPAEKGTSTKFDPSKKFQTTVIWTTPLGLPVVQPYRTRKARRVVTSLQTVSIVDPSAEDVVSRRKQLQAFPPNFIHSLDATHMIMSANACQDAGLTFSAVHDSFWTHASDVDSMNSILRDAFVQMHSDDIVGRLAAEFNVRYGKNLFLAKVDANSEIGRTLRKRRKANVRNARLIELIDEHRRQTLLRSDDPADQAEGRAMETSASIFEKLGGTDKHLAMASTLGETTVGHVPDDLAAAERGPSSNVDTSDPAIQSLFTEIDMMDTQTSAAEAEVDDAMVAEDGTKDELQPTKKKQRQKPHTWLWLPLRFRPVPTKGSWDLSRIRDSQYFFS